MMTFPAALDRPSARPSTLPSAPRGFGLRPANGVVPAPRDTTSKRMFEVAALRADGSLYVGQHRAPAVALLENAFSAFARGTLIDTDKGQVAIEDLQPGDTVKTSTGESAMVQWIGSSNFVPADAGRRTPLIRIMNDSFGMGRPGTFLTVGPSARVLYTPHHLRAEAAGRQMFTSVREFVDGVNVIEVTPPTPVRLFHLCLTRHAAITVGGLQMETYHPGLSATREVSHAVRDYFLSLFPHIGHITDFGPLAHPRAPETPVEG